MATGLLRIEQAAGSVVVLILLHEGRYGWPRFCGERHCCAVQPLRPGARSVVAGSAAQGRIHVLPRSRPVVLLDGVVDPSLVDSGCRNVQGRLMNPGIVAACRPERAGLTDKGGNG